MIDNKGIKTAIFELQSALRGAFFSKNIGFATIRLMFLKYAADNCLGAYTREQMQDYLQLQKTFSARCVEGGPNVIWPIIKIVDNHYKLNGIIDNSINEYAKELFGLDDKWNLKNGTTSREFVQIMSVISMIDLTDDLESFTVGKMLVNELIDNLLNQVESSKYPYFSRKEIGQIAKKILDVKENEMFLDFASGIGSTTISIVGDVKCRIKNYEIYKEALSISAMLYIMQGYNNFVLENRDSLILSIEDDQKLSENELADKIFVDAPVGIRIKESPLRESSLIVLFEAVERLKTNGKAIITVLPASLSSFGYAQKARKKLVESGYIQSVVSLPLTRFSSTITINMVVISKNKNDEILFVNACNESFKQHITVSQKIRGGISITEEGMEFLSRIILENLEIETISKKVPTSYFNDKDCDLSPNLYVTQVIEFEKTTLNEIDANLEELYSKLKYLIN